MANQLVPKKYIFDRDFTAVQFQEFQNPPTDNSNKTYMKGTIVDGVIKTGYQNDFRIVTIDGYDITDGVSLAPENTTNPVVNPPFIVHAPGSGPRTDQPTFSKNEKIVIFFVLLILVIIIIVNESK